MGESFGVTKDYLGIVFPIAIQAVGSSLMALVGAKTAGDYKNAKMRSVTVAVMWFWWFLKRAACLIRFVCCMIELPYTISFTLTEPVQY